MNKLQPIAKIDVNNIFFQLDQIARENADTADIQVVNLGVDQDKNTFSGPGEILIVACAKSEDKIGNDESKFKTTCFDALKKYIEFFASKVVSSKMKEDDLEPVRTTLQAKDDKDKNNKKDAPKKESIDWRKPLLFLMVEAGEENKETSNKETANKDSNSVDEAPSQKIVGYSIPYKLEIEGQKDIDLKITAKKIGSKLGGFAGSIISGFVNGTASIGKDLLKSMFGNVASDLASIKFHTFGNHSVGVKDITDPAMKISKSIAKVFKTKVVPFLKDTFLSKDINEIQSKLQARLNEKYPNTTAKVEKEKKNVLLTDLKKKNKLTTDVKKILDNPKLDMCLVVSVKSDDKNYPMYTVEAIAKHLAAVAGNSLSKIAKIDDEKEKAEVVNFLSKNYAIAKVPDYENVNKPNVATSNKTKKESLDLLVSRMNLIFEDADAVKILEVSQEFDDIYSKIESTLLDTDENVDPEKIRKYVDELLKARDEKELKAKDLFPEKGDKRGVTALTSKLLKAKTKEQIGNAFVEIDGSDALNKLLNIALRANPVEEQPDKPEDKKDNKDANKDVEKTDKLIDIRKKQGTVEDLYIIAKPKAWNQISSKNKEDKQETTDKENK